MEQHKPSVRVFLVSSQISCLFALMYVKDQALNDCKDVVIIDEGKQKRLMADAMLELLQLHSWYNILDFSKTREEKQVQLEGQWKRLTRKYRNKKWVRPFYRFALNMFKDRQSLRQKKALLQQLNLPAYTAPTEIFLLTETALNKALHLVFPQAGINYIEHGLSDYMHLQRGELAGNFYCLFHEEFELQLKKKSNINKLHVLPIYRQEIFYELVSQQLKKLGYSKQLEELIPEGKTAHLLLLQNFEHHGVDPAIHVDFLNKVLNYTGANDEEILLIKLHPLQLPGVVRQLETFLKEKKVSYKILQEEYFQFTGVETLFYLWRKRITKVFTIYSSGVFYLSKLYPESHIEYFYMKDLIRGYMHGFAPDVRLWLNTSLEQMDSVFAANCRNL